MKDIILVEIIAINIYWVSTHMYVKSYHACEYINNIGKRQETQMNYKCVYFLHGNIQILFTQFLYLIIHLLCEWNFIYNFVKLLNFFFIINIEPNQGEALFFHTYIAP